MQSGVAALKDEIEASWPVEPFISMDSLEYNTDFLNCWYTGQMCSQLMSKQEVELHIQEL